MTPEQEFSPLSELEKASQEKQQNEPFLEMIIKRLNVAEDNIIFAKSMLKEYIEENILDQTKENVLDGVTETNPYYDKPNEPFKLNNLIELDPVYHLEEEEDDDKPLLSANDVKEMKKEFFQGIKEAGFHLSPEEAAHLEEDENNWEVEMPDPVEDVVPFVEIEDLVDKVQANPEAEPPKLVPIVDLTKSLVEAGFTNQLDQVHDSINILSGGLGAYAVVLENQVSIDEKGAITEITFRISPTIPTPKYPEPINFIITFTCLEGEITMVKLTEFKEDEIIHHITVNKASLEAKELPTNFVISSGVSKVFSFFSNLISSALPHDVINDELKDGPHATMPNF